MKRVSFLKKLAKGLSKLFFCWTLPLFWKGLRRDLSKEDLGTPHSSNYSGVLADELEHNWFEEIKRTEPIKKKPSLLKTLTKTYFCSYILDGVLILIQYVCLKSFQPLLLALLLSFFTGGCSKEYAFYYAAGLTLMSTGNVFIQHHTTYRQQRLGMRIRIACCSLIYRKLLRLSTYSLSKITAGQLINLLSNDVNRFDPVLKFLHILWVVPIQIAVCCYLYYHKVSSLALVGVAFILLQTIPLQTYFSKLGAKLRLEIAQRTDERVRLIDEIVCSIQVIKMYAWEKPFEEAVKEIRKKELVSVGKQAFLRAITSSFIIFTERSSLYVVLLGHVLLRYPFDAPTVYSLAQFYNMLQIMMASVYPNAVSSSVECLVSIRRIQEFLLLEERPQFAITNGEPAPILAKNPDKSYGIDNVAFEHPSQPNKYSIMTGWDNKITQTPVIQQIGESDKVAVELMGVSASWEESGSENIKDLFLRIPPGKLCVVIGPVGAGKTSLLQLLLKELPASSGVVSVCGEMSYASQMPWLFVSTIRNNILFGQPYSPKRYRAVVHVCALEQDFQQFPRGDQTLVGERGVSLSGGQRARINLARAVYRQADIYLLDDPLSCVDAPVGAHLFHMCVKDYLRGKTRILVTHQLHYLKCADMIIIMENGKIEKIGTFEDLKRAGQDFTGLLDVNTNNVKGSKEDLTSHAPTCKNIREMSRRISVTSTGKPEYEEKEPDAPEEECEAQVSGRMQASVFWKYWMAGKSPYLLVSMVIIIILGQLTASATDYWVTYWTNQHNQKHQLMIKQIRNLFLTAADGNLESSLGLLNYEKIPKSNRTRFASFLKSHNITGPLLHNYTKIKHETLTDELHRYVGPFTTLQYVCVYSVLIGLCVILAITGSSLFFKACVRSSGGLHRKVFSRILRARMQFFDKNPSGRILNRFSKDMGAIDEWMPKDMMEAVQVMLFIANALIMVSITNSWLLIPVFIILVLFYILISMYLSTAQNIKRLEGITRSPVFSHAMATIQGMSTIRSSNAQEKQIKEFDSRQDVHTAAWCQFLASRCTLGFWLDITCVMFVTCVTLSFIIFNDESVLSGHVGLAISQALFLTTTLQFGVRQLTEVIAHLTSAERMQQYLNVEVEDGLEKGDKPTPKNWPSKGDVMFKHVSLSYQDGEKPVLNNLNIQIQSGWKVGIVGRTGAGKSSLISALFRLARVDGCIYVDHVESGTVALQDLRSSISIIPQEPVLFSSTMRYNLDPFGRYDDSAMWNALEAVDMKDAILSLDFQVQEGGANFSVGQKQLICLARAILRNNKILVLDEATANMDPQTDYFIQKIIRERFHSCTVITIAHRLNTIMDSDRVIVMDQGTIAEYGRPLELLKIKDGILAHMVQESGAEIASVILSLAYDSCKDLDLAEKESKERIDISSNVQYESFKKKCK